ncbi:MAG: protein kinase domain-containing protein [Polyangiaceae bacterium]
MSAGDPLGLSGTVLHEQFRVGELSDDSRRAYLYKGEEIAQGDTVALKFLKIPAAFASEAFLKRFRHETRLHYALAQASPDIVRVLAGGTVIAPATHTRVAFSVLEWLHGKTLAADFAERRAHWGKGRSIEEAIHLLDPAAEALATAHRHGVVHREVTPANLFVCDLGKTTTLKVLDFGLAKVMNETAAGDGGRAKTVDMGPLASPIYAAPEQFSREAGEVGPATDLYSLVMIFLEALRDRAVMDDSRSPLAVRVLDKNKRPTPRALGIDVGENLELAIAEAVAVRVADRPKDIGVYWDNLKKAALKDARALAISAPPKMHSRSDIGEDDETEVQIDLTFLRQSQVPTVPHPEPATLSRPMIDEEPLSSTGELFAMQIPPTQPSVAQPHAAGAPKRARTLVSPGQDPQQKFHGNATLPTLVSAAPKPPPVTIANEPVVSSAVPFHLTKDTIDPPPTPVMPLAQPQQSAPAWISTPQPPPHVVSMRPPESRAMPWVTMIAAFLVVGVVLASIAIYFLR